MTVHGCQLHGIKNTAADTEIGIRMDTDSGRQFICPFKADAINVLRQTVGVFLQDAVYLKPICIVYLDSQGIGNPEFLQIDHRLPHPLLFLQQGADFHGFPFTYPLDFRKTFRFFLHNTEGILSEFPDNSCRKRRAYPFYRPGSQIALDACSTKPPVSSRFSPSSRVRKVPTQVISSPSETSSNTV